MAVDKKRVGGRLRFVVPRGVGDVVVVQDVPEHLVREVLATVAVGRAGRAASAETRKER
jgi:3-dehydroquinate synthetase